MAADSGSDYLATLLRRGARPFHSLSAPRAPLAHAPDASPDHAPAAENSPTTFASIFELSLEETAEFRHEARLDQDVASQSQPVDRLAPDNRRIESQPVAPHPAGNTEHAAAPPRFDQRGERGHAPQDVSQQATEAQLPAIGSFASQTASETSQQSTATAQISASQETTLKEVALAGTRAERLAETSVERVERLEKSVERFDSTRLTDVSEGKAARQASLAGEPRVAPQPAEQTLKVERGEHAAANLHAERVETQAPPLDFTAQANAAFNSERERGADLQRAENMAAQSKSGTLTIKRLEVQLINQTPAPSPAPQTNARPLLARTTRTNSLHRHHLGRFSWGL